jgi:cell division control protein 24
MQRLPSATSSSSYTNLSSIRTQSFGSGPPPPLNRTMTAPVLDSSTYSINSIAPSAAAGSIFNKPATVSLYQTCRIITDRLRQVSGFEEVYLQDMGIVQSPLSTAKDPVTDLWKCFRVGASLCHLYNATLPEIELSVRPEATTNNMNACKAEVYHFLLACKKHLGFADEDLFTISELYSENTNGFVKVRGHFRMC